MIKWIILASLMLNSFAVFADSVQEKMEQAIYAEETSGNLEQAIAIYSDIIQTQTQSQTRLVQAHFRLAQCYKKLGKTQMAKQQFNIILANFSDNLEFTKPAQQALLELSVDPVALKPVTWPNHETLTYHINNHAGNQLGAMEFTATQSPNSQWTFQSYSVVPVSQLFNYYEVLVDDSFSPVSSKVNSSLHGEISASYLENYVELNSKNPQGKHNQRKINTNTAIYDNEQMFYALRRLPLETGFTANFDIFVAVNANIVPAILSVETSEKITIGLGTYDTYRVKLNFPGNENLVPAQTFWVSTEQHHYVVKYETNQVTMVLNKTGVRDQHYVPSFKDSRVGLTLNADKNWRFLEVAIPPYPNPLQFILPDTLEVYGIFASRYGDFSQSFDINDIARQDLEVLKSSLNAYTLIEKPTPKQIEQLAARAFKGEFIENGKTLQEYRVYTLGEKGIYWFVLRGTQDKMLKYQKEFDTMIQQFSAD